MAEGGGAKRSRLVDQYDVGLTAGLTSFDR